MNSKERLYNELKPQIDKARDIIKKSIRNQPPELREAYADQFDSYQMIESYLICEDEEPIQTCGTEILNAFCNGDNESHKFNLSGRLTISTTVLFFPVPINNFSEEFHNHLIYSQQYESTKKKYERLLALIQEYREQTQDIEFKIQYEIKLYNCLGEVCLKQFNYDEAHENYNKAYKLAEENNNLTELGMSLRGLGKIATYHSQVDIALRYFQDHYGLANSIGDAKQIIISGQNLAELKQQFCTLTSEENFKNIINLYNQTIRLSQKHEDRRSEAIGFTGIANCYYRLKDYTRAIEYYQQALNIYTDIDDDIGIIKSSFRMGEINQIQGYLEQAYQKYKICQNVFKNKMSQKIIKELEESSYTSIYIYQIQIHLYLSQIALSQGKIDEALSYNNNLLELSQKLNNQHYKCIALMVKGDILSAVNNFREAIQFYKESLDMAIKFKDEANLMLALYELSRLYNELEDYAFGLKYANQSRRKYLQRLKVNPHNIDDRRNYSYAVGNCGVAFRGLGKYKIAIRTLQEAYNISVQLHDVLNQWCQLYDLGLTYKIMGDIQQAEEKLMNSLYTITLSSKSPNHLWQVSSKSFLQIEYPLETLKSLWELSDIAIHYLELDRQKLELYRHIADQVNQQSVERLSCQQKYEQITQLLQPHLEQRLIINQ